MRTANRELIQQLRRKGMTYSEINERLGLNISKGTLSYICRSITLSDRSKKRIEEKSANGLIRGRQVALISQKEARKGYFLTLENKYAKLRSHLNFNKESALIALALLYLTEGSKQSGKLMFGNSDPRLITLFLKLLNECFDIDPKKFRCTVQCRADQEVPMLEEYWSNITGIQPSQFYKARIDKRTLGKRTLKPDYKGVCRIDYFSGYIYNELQVIISLIT
ncbi:MAG: hypothetical protein WEC83_00295 [Patescibacteria group bacterium]